MSRRNGARVPSRFLTQHSDTGLGLSIAEVLRPLHPYTAALLACEVEDGKEGERLRSIAGEVPDPVAPVSGCVFAPRCTHAIERCRSETP